MSAKDNAHSMSAPAEKITPHPDPMTHEALCACGNAHTCQVGRADGELDAAIAEAKAAVPEVLSNHEVTLMRAKCGGRVLCVVTYADPVIWLSDGLIEGAREREDARGRALDTQRDNIAGAIEISDQTITFGVEGHGLGRLTYRLTGNRVGFGAYEAVRVDG